jgi:hypothetical protein
MHERTVTKNYYNTVTVSLDNKHASLLRQCEICMIFEGQSYTELSDFKYTEICLQKRHHFATTNVPDLVN